MILALPARAAPASRESTNQKTSDSNLMIGAGAAPLCMGAAGVVSLAQGRSKSEKKPGRAMRGLAGACMLYAYNCQVGALCCSAKIRARRGT